MNLMSSMPKDVRKISQSYDTRSSRQRKEKSPYKSNMIRRMRDGNILSFISNPKMQMGI